MKRIFSIIIVAVACFAMFSCDGLTTNTSAVAKSTESNANASQNSIPIPALSYFQERRTVNKWAQRWDKPSVPTYVYLVSYGKVLGYYVADGKPASTQSYMLPEEMPTVMRPIGYNDHSVGLGVYMMQSPDLDGTYGANNPGIRFFTSSGVAVEWAGDGASYLYSDAPIDFGYFVPRLDKEAK